MKYFKRSVKHTPSHMNNINHHQNSTTTPPNDNHTCTAHSHHQVNDITSETCKPFQTTPTSEDIPDSTNIDSSNYISHFASDSEGLS